VKEKWGSKGCCCCCFGTAAAALGCCCCFAAAKREERERVLGSLNEERERERVYQMRLFSSSPSYL